MKALPDIKTANKVVELVLKNASIAVTGIWQADDDGVINPATIKLVPGTIIPKAVGSAGLTPLETPGRFDVSELVLDQLRNRIRKALFVDQLGQVNGPRMTATEVLERAAEMARILGATYGRLQSELLSPLVTRARGILARRGEIPDLPLDHRMVALEYKSPQARYQAQGRRDPAGRSPRSRARGRSRRAARGGRCLRLCRRRSPGPPSSVPNSPIDMTEMSSG